MQDIKNYLENTPFYQQWMKIGIKHHHGICLPLFSIRSHHSSGIGEFNDLFLLIDLCEKIGFDTIQILPINEMSKNDFSPYSALSSYALDPIYLSLSFLPFIEENPSLQKSLKKLKKYNSSSRVKYSIKAKKLFFLEQYFDLFFERFQNLSSFNEFLSTYSWLKPYAVFKVLKNKFKEKEWFCWPKESKSKNLIDLFEENKKEAMRYIFFQYLCFSQLSNVKSYATSKKYC